MTVASEKTAGMDGARPVGPGHALNRYPAVHAPAAPGARLRRRSLLTTLGASAVSCVLGEAGATALGAASTRGSVPQPGPLRRNVRYVVTDRRFAQSLDHGRSLVAQGARRLEVTEGLTRLWQDALAPLWQSQDSGEVVGLTTFEVWQCLSEQARGAWHASHLLQHHGLADADHPSSLVSWTIT